MRMEASSSASHRTHPVVGVLQLNSTSDKEANFMQAKALIHKAKQQGATVGGGGGYMSCTQGQR